MSVNKHIPDIERIEPRAVLAVEAQEMKLYASIAKNESAAAFAKQLSPLEVGLKDDGRFSKNGVLPFILPFDANDIETEPGDVILTDKDRIAVCYDREIVKAVRLGERTYKSREQILEIFGTGDANVRFYLEWGE
ncbi:MAG: hypothetical protein IJS71_07420 [Clostridia bacterium]|nr:hypothetical protein [Clostridia bacterium]